GACRRGRTAPWHRHTVDGAAHRAHPRHRGRAAPPGKGDAGGAGRSADRALMNIAFEGRRAVVTGAGHGFGRAIAAAFALRGARVYACDINAAGLAEPQALTGCRIATVDVTPPAEVEEFVAQAAEGAAVDILVNNAGGVLGQIGRPLEQISPADWQAI